MTNSTYQHGNGNHGQHTRLDALVLQHLSDRVILKPLTRWNEAYKEFPRYVLEYLCARYIDPNDPLSGQKKIDRILQEHYVESGAKELIKHRIVERGEYTLLGPLSLVYDQRRLHYWADVPALGDSNVRVSDRVLKEFGDTLLTSGAWGTMKIEFDPEYTIGKNAYPFRVVDFTPFQVTRLSLEDYVEKRRLFSTQDWIDLLVQTVGFNPAHFPERVKHLILLRLVPFVEANYNLIEAGKLDVASTDTLKNYMAQGSYSKDGIEFTSTCSIVLSGNIKTDLENRCPLWDYRHLFQPLPEELREDTAFLDRVHAYLPGWEMPVIAPSDYATGYGFISDYAAEIFRLLRRRNYQTHLVARVRFPAGMSQRAHDAIQKTGAGLLKLVYPHRTPDDVEPDELRFCLDLAVEMR